MKKIFHLPKRPATSLLALLLACLLALGTGAVPAQAEEFSASSSASETAEASLLAELTQSQPEGEESSQLESSQPEGEESSRPESSQPEGEEPSQPESSQPEGEEPSQPESSQPEDEESSRPESSQPEDEESSRPEEETVFTLTFQMGNFGTETVEVLKGELPQVPEIPSLPGATVLGWYDQNGQPADPASLPVEGDATYTARWSREVGSLLNTDYHVIYLTGYDDGLFRPSNPVSRAEAAQMLYNMLRSTNWERKSFPDVPEGAWYQDAVETLAGLGILSGYTDGTFAPTHQITRAEFVAMVVAFTTLKTGTPSFSDVPANYWAAPYIYTASQLGWVQGYEDGTFQPGGFITRAEAVTVFNKMLGREADPAFVGKSDVKNFYDMFPEHWAYSAVVEASTAHAHVKDAQPEKWDYYVPDTAIVQGHWVQNGGKRYYVDPKTKKLARNTTVLINGVNYRFGSDFQLYTGFGMNGAWRRYFVNGLQQTDISELGVVSGPYYIKVYKPANYLIIFAKDPDSGSYNTPVKAMRVSCGNPTPTGTFYTPAKFRWLKMVGNTWAQWCTQIQGNYLFHSVPNWTRNNLDLEVDEYNRLGQTRSLGCIRLNCADAKWIYDNCRIGTQVYISRTETSGPLSKPAGITIPSWHTWDPTDPTAYYMCDRYGCHQDLQE